MQQPIPAAPSHDPRSSIGAALWLALGRYDTATSIGDLDLDALASSVAEALERDRDANASASPVRLARDGRKVEALNASNDV